MKKFLLAMDEKTKKMFTMFIIAIGLFVAVFASITIVRLVSGPKLDYPQIVKTMTSASEKYYKNKNKLPSDGKTSKITLSALSDTGYMKDISKYTNDTCSGYVTVTNNNGEYLYIPSLKCSKYKSTTLIDAIKKDIVTSLNGVYNIGGEYIFKGDKVNNFITIDGSMWRILKVDSDGFIKLIKDTQETARKTWDNRFNIVTNSNSGINDYPLSRVHDSIKVLYNDEKKISKNARKYITKHTWCYDKVALTDKSINTSNICKTSIDDYIGLITPTDYIMASFDTNCNKTDAKSCANYNYMRELLASAWTMTAVSDNTDQVYAIENGLVSANKASENNYVSMVIYIDGANLYTSGNGTINSPYKIN